MRIAFVGARMVHEYKNEHDQTRPALVKVELNTRIHWNTREQTRLRLVLVTSLSPHRCRYTGPHTHTKLHAASLVGYLHDPQREVTPHAQSH